jgi:hypothetical protein
VDVVDDRARTRVVHHGDGSVVHSDIFPDHQTRGVARFANHMAGPVVDEVRRRGSRLVRPLIEVAMGAGCERTGVQAGARQMAITVIGELAVQRAALQCDMMLRLGMANAPLNHMKTRPAKVEVYKDQGVGGTFS